tara:strand:+ start:372 stop:908 length:537 start_codon:yes stop_codon:yes gene_type:complete
MNSNNQNKQSMNFSEKIKFKNGAVSGAFITVNDEPVKIKLCNIVAPLGISHFNNKTSILLNLNESHDISQIEDIQAGVSCNDEWSNYNFNPLIKCSDKYGSQIKANVTPETSFFDNDGQHSSQDILKSRCEVSILLQANMVWFRGKDSGVSLKILQIKHIRNIDTAVAHALETQDCSL